VQKTIDFLGDIKKRVYFCADLKTLIYRYSLSNGTLHTNGIFTLHFLFPKQKAEVFLYKNTYYVLHRTRQFDAVLLYIFTKKM